MARRQERAEATRQSIIDAAVELFRDVGFSETDMTNVVQRAGVPGGTCYYYFPTKMSLAEAIVEKSNAIIAGAVGPIWDSDAPSMHKIISATFRFIAVTENDDVAWVGYQLRQSIRQFSRMHPGDTGDTHVLFGSGLKRAIADGHVRAGINRREVAGTLVAAVVGSRLLADCYGDDPIDRLSAAWRTLLQAIASEEGRAGLIRVVNAEARKQR